MIPRKKTKWVVPLVPADSTNGHVPEPQLYELEVMWREDDMIFDRLRVTALAEAYKLSGGRKWIAAGLPEKVN